MITGTVMMGYLPIATEEDSITRVLLPELRDCDILVVSKRRVRVSKLNTPCPGRTVAPTQVNIVRNNGELVSFLITDEVGNDNSDDRAHAAENHDISHVALFGTGYSSPYLERMTRGIPFDLRYK